MIDYIKGDSAFFYTFPQEPGVISSTPSSKEALKKVLLKCKHYTS